MTDNNNHILVVKDKIAEAQNIVTVRFVPEKGGVFPFKAGQFVNVHFLDDRCGGHGKAYTISNVPGEPFIDITVKKVGAFSGALHDLAIGEKVGASDPHGYFYPEDELDNLVFLAGGIGITPFHSVIRELFLKKADKDIHLFYSNKTREDGAFLKEFDAMAKQWNRLKITYVLTQETLPSGHYESKRIDTAMLTKHLKTLDKKYFFICGSIGFVRELRKDLKENGVGEEFIRVESFF